MKSRLPKNIKNSFHFQDLPSYEGTIIALFYQISSFFLKPIIFSKYQSKVPNNNNNEKKVVYMHFLKKAN